jgi:rfaE bifunctional protein kinase chain/domain
MLDRYWSGAVDRISPEAPVPVVRVSTIDDRPGGAANAAANVAALGAYASLLAPIGSDEPGGSLRKLLERAGVECHGLGADKTTVKLRVTCRAQQLLRMDFESHPGGDVLAQMLGEFSRAMPLHDVVLFSDYGKGSLAQVRQMILQAKDAGKAVLVDPKGADFSRYSGASVITPNTSELRLAIGPWANESELESKVQTLRRCLNIGAVLLTRSEDGMSLFDDSGRMDVPSTAREVYDVTGAGDTVISVLSVMIAAGVDLRSAAPIANRAAGIVVGKSGTAVVSYDELFSSPETPQ